MLLLILYVHIFRCTYTHYIKYSPHVCEPFARPIFALCVSVCRVGKTRYAKRWGIFRLFAPTNINSDVVLFFRGNSASFSLPTRKMFRSLSKLRRATCVCVCLFVGGSFLLRFESRIKILCAALKRPN